MKSLKETLAEYWKITLGKSTTVSILETVRDERVQ
jgi:hypothetical protein